MLTVTGNTFVCRELTGDRRPRHVKILSQFAPQRRHAIVDGIDGFVEIHANGWRFSRWRFSRASSHRGRNLHRLILDCAAACEKALEFADATCKQPENALFGEASRLEAQAYAARALAWARLLQHESISHAKQAVAS